MTIRAEHLQIIAPAVAAFVSGGDVIEVKESEIGGISGATLAGPADIPDRQVAQAVHLVDALNGFDSKLSVRCRKQGSNDFDQADVGGFLGMLSKEGEVSRGEAWTVFGFESLGVASYSLLAVQRPLSCFRSSLSAGSAMPCGFIPDERGCGMLTADRHRRFLRSPPFL